MEMDEENEEHKSCPKIEPTNNNMMDLPYEEKLNIVEKEVQSLYEFCMEKKFTNTEIYNCVSNLHGPRKSVTKKVYDDSARTLLILSGIIGVISMLVIQPEIWALTNVHAKLFAIKMILPHWDWASLYEEDCMFSNHWLPEKVVTNYTSDECKYCQKFQVERLENVTHEFITKIVADGDAEPVVVKDIMKDWGNLTEFTIEEIIQIYQNHHLLANTLGSCLYQNNAGFSDMFYDFFNAYADNKLPTDQWHASWVNCDAKASKVIRGYHPRPYFLPPMVQLGIENSVIVAKGDSNDTFTLLKTGGYGGTAKAKWVTIISGSLEFTLKPAEDCVQFGCVDSVIKLLPGETLFYVTEFWQSYYISADPGITVAVANNVMWDDVN